jgi:hypothetical protein
MKATEFVYWLQGHFEIDGTGKPLSDTQARQILDKATTVKAGPDRVEQDSQSFVTYVQGLLFPVSEGLAGPDYLKAATKKLTEKLHDLFVHAIDPSYAGDRQPELQKVHDGQSGRPKAPPRDPPGLERMC